jgi:hypothetical protein
MSPLPYFPMGPILKGMSFSRTLLYITFMFPIKEPPLRGFPNRILLELDAAFPEPCFNKVTNFPVGGNIWFTIEDPWREIPFPKVFFNTYVPGKPFQVSQLNPHWGEMPVSRTFLYTSLYIPRTAAFSRSPNRDLIEIDAPISELSFIYLLNAQ